MTYGYSKSVGIAHADSVLLKDIKNLSNLVNGEWGSKPSRLLLEVFPSLAFDAEVHRFRRLESACRNTETPELRNLKLGEYDVCSENNGNRRNAIVELKQTLTAELNPRDVSVVIHGSIGSCETINYSDFDGLIVFSDRVMADPVLLAKYALVFFQARRFLYKYDPLQHHGWFAISESQAKFWPETFLPTKALSEAAVIYGELPISIPRMKCLSRTDTYTILRKIIVGLEKEVSTGAYKKNLYFLKCTTSKIMLLPALYLQARYGESVSKKDSFKIAAADFSAEEWKVVKVASDLRERWPLVPPLFPSVLAERPGILGTRYRRAFSLSDTSCQQFLEPSFEGDVVEFLSAVKKRLHEF